MWSLVLRRNIHSSEDYCVLGYNAVYSGESRDVSKENIAYIFRTKGKPSKKSA
jgi:hypothetical protein